MSIRYGNGFDQYGPTGPTGTGCGAGNPASGHWVGGFMNTDGFIGGPDAYATSDNTPDGEGTAMFVQFGETMDLVIDRAPKSIIASVKAWNDIVGAGWAVMYLCYWAGDTHYAFQYQCILSVNADGSLQVDCMTNVPEVNSHWPIATYKTAPGIVSPSTWHQYELYYGCDLSNGTIVLRVDGVTVLSLFGVPTISNVTGELPDVGFTEAVNIIVLPASPNIHTRTIYDDLIVIDPTDGIGLIDFPGKCRVGAIPVVADGGVNSMTPSTGADHFACVDQFPSSEGSTYLAATATGQTQQFVPGPLPGDVIDILAVIPCARGKGDGTVGYQTTMVLDGEEFVTPTFVPPSGYYATNPQTVMEIDPLGGTWTVKSFPTALLGVTAE
jgi:hypothetical protein